MKKVFWLIVLVMFVSTIGVMAVKAAEQKKVKDKTDMQANPKKLGFRGTRGIPQTVTLSATTLKTPVPKWSKALAFDSSATLRELAKMPYDGTQVDKPEDLGFEFNDNKGHSRDGALQTSLPGLNIPSTIANFEGLSNQDNFNIFGGRVNPPDPDGDVGPNHYMEIINLVIGIYSKSGTKLLGPVPLGAVWNNFAISDCEDSSGDGIVLYDQHVGRWLISQFTTAASDGNFYNCVAISKTGDPLGAYYRYAFSAGPYFPDYPKYGVWPHSYLLTSRDFGPNFGYAISVYALEKAQMISGNPNARAVQFFLEAFTDAGDVGSVPLELIGDGLLPPDWDGTRKPQTQAAIPIVGTQDDDSDYGATFDAINIWDLRVLWNSIPSASLVLEDQLATAEFDSIYPCNDPALSGDTARDCLPQPGVNDHTRELDILSYRQRPTWRLAYRNFGTYETMVTNQSVEANPSHAGVRWYEIRRQNGGYSIYQQGTFAPDPVHRWMPSPAMDKAGNIALGYSVVLDAVDPADDVKPGIRYTGRLKGDPLGQMTQGEGSVIEGTGVQMTNNSRWGDYTSLHIDPKDDCTFWYVNEYYQVDGVIGVNTVPWQTRIGSFKLPGCK